MNLIDQSLHNLQAGLYRSLLTSVSPATIDDLAVAARELTGAKLLLESFIALGLPQTLEENDDWRSLLYGSERIPDTDVLMDLCSQGVVKSQTQLDRNERLDIAGILDERITRLETLLNQRLAEIEASGRAEGQYLVETTLRNIEVFRTLRSAPEFAPAIAMGNASAGGATVSVFGEPGGRYRVWGSTNLTDWILLPGEVFSGGTVFDPGPPNPGRRFYKAQSAP